METSRRAYLLTGDQASLRAGLRAGQVVGMAAAWPG